MPNENPSVALMGRLLGHIEAINKDLSLFMADEYENTKNTAAQVEVTAYDILYKYLQYPYSGFARAAQDKLTSGDHWQSSEGVVYENIAATDSTMATVRVRDYMHQLKRSGRVGEDRKGYLPLSDVRAIELGYVPPKKAK